MVVIKLNLNENNIICLCVFLHKPFLLFPLGHLSLPSGLGNPGHRSTNSSQSCLLSK